jgi:fatty acid desaturase
MQELLLSDPTYSPPATESRAEGLAERFILDRRDLPFLKLMAVTTLTVVPTGLLLFVPGQFRWWLAGVHLVLVIYFMGPFVLMLHNTSHRRLFRRPWTFMNQYIPWVLGPFFGESPETYFGHHVGMHHPENNLEGDLSSTMKYQRDSVLGFGWYFLRFFVGALPDLATYMARKKRHGLMLRVMTGELLFYFGVAALFTVNWRATLCVFFLPFVITRFAMMAGNWGQHAFIDAASPENCYRNSITCINSSYNRRCFNDGYHIGHHIKQTRHWTEMPVDFRDNMAKYSEERAIVFDRLDFFGVWLCLMLGRYDWLARRYVHLGGGGRPSEEEIIGLLRTRTARI